MDEPTPTRAWWKRKRWWAVLLLWLAVGYPAAYGPVGYAVCRGWIGERFYRPFGPIDRVLNPLRLRDPPCPLVTWYYDGYLLPLCRLAVRHNGVEWDGTNREP